MSLRRRMKLRREGTKANIDMNSLIDLTFLLLVVFIVTLPQLEQSVTVILPSDKIEQKKDNKLKPIFVTVDTTGKIFLGDKPTTMDAVKEFLQQKVKEDPENVTVVVRGDVRSTYGDVYELFKIAKDCNVKHLSMASVDK